MQRIRKSQMEVLGLAFVFIILIFGLLIFVRLSSNAPQDRGRFIDPQTAASFVSSILKTSVNCSQFHVYTITELLKDCGESKRITCQGQTSCNITKEVINDILNMTLTRQQKSYFFLVNTSTNDELMKNQTSICGFYSPGVYYRQPFYLNGPTLYIHLRICDFY